MNEEDPTDDKPVVSKLTAEIGVALLLFLFGSTVVYDSHRLGSSWGSDGPQSGYFPFYIGTLICLSSLATLAQALYAQWRGRQEEFSAAAAAQRKPFVTWVPFKRVLAVLIPSIVFVVFVQFIGIYVASAVYIALFMVWLGKYSWLKSVTVGVAVSISIFLLFEIWFKFRYGRNVHPAGVSVSSRIEPVAPFRIRYHSNEVSLPNQCVVPAS